MQTRWYGRAAKTRDAAATMCSRLAALRRVWGPAGLFMGSARLLAQAAPGTRGRYNGTDRSVSPDSSLTGGWCQDEDGFSARARPPRGALVKSFSTASGFFLDSP